MPKLRESKAISKSSTAASTRESRGAKARKELEKKEFVRRRDMLMTSCLTNQQKQVVGDDDFKRK